MAQSGERITTMNPAAVNEAKVYTGSVHFYDGEHVEMEGVPFVEVGKWTNAGEEQLTEDFDCSYYAAQLLGFSISMSWLPASEEKNGKRKYLIYKESDENDRPVPFSPEEAHIIASQINHVLQVSREAREEYMHEELSSD